MSNIGTGDHALLHGRIDQDWYATHIAVRLEEFFFPTTPWQRRLWDAGTLSALKELLDASMWCHRRVLSQGSLVWFTRELEQTVGVDAGVGDRATKKAVVDL